ncbi:MAG: hypothetical protein IKD79_04280 [Oscillospiraceae bacterium]|nr:hypothetical protein [Oscillospiraceae bacterium]
MAEKKTSPLYKLIKWLVWVFYPRTAVVGAENLPEEPCVIVGNHTQMNGPIVSELYLPVERYTWCAGEMMHLRKVPAYAYRDFWSRKPRYIRWFYRLLSYVIAPIAVCVFNNANTVPVYRDMRIVATFRESVEKLCSGASLVIFPEHEVKYNHILYDFQDRFIDLARLYFKKTGKPLQFVPMYIAPALKTAYLGKPVRFRPDAPMTEERRRIKAYLMDEITAIACSLPPHTVVPYPNLPRRDYPRNLPPEVQTHEDDSV